MKKLISILLISIVILNVVSSQSYAGSSPSIVFKKNGDLEFTTIGTKAKSGTRYSTIGWQIFNGSRDVSLNIPRTSSAVLRLERNTDKKDEDLYEDKDSVTYGDKVVTTFYIDYERIVKRIKEESENSPEWAEELLTEGGTVYLDPVYTIKIAKGNGDFKFLGSLDESGEKSGEVYYSLEGEETLLNGRKHIEAKGIKYARSWYNPNDFEGDYDIPLEFPSFMSKVIVSHKIKRIDGTIINMPNESEEVFHLKHGMSEVVAKKAFAGYKYQALTLEKDGALIETLTEPSIKVLGKNKYKAEEFKEPEEGSFKTATLTFLYTPVDVTGTYRLKAEPDNLQVEGDKIASEAKITIDLTQDAKSVEDWRVYMQGESTVVLDVKLIRDKSGATFEPTPNNGDTYRYTVPPNQLIRYFQGESLPDLYADNLMEHPIAPGETVELKYDADISVTVRGKKIPLNGNDDTASFFRMPETDGYVSTPSYYAEIKQGNVYAEEFEAMAGTPTTRNLYFASGGSEFIVDIEVEYVPHATASRRYTSSYKEVWCEHRDKHIGPLHTSSISGKTGGWSTSNPGAPTPRTITGYDGTVHAESTSVASKTVTDTPATETTSAVTHTEYQQVWSGISSHTGCGPCHDRKVGGYSDTWTQNVTFDYLKINKVNVWEIKEAMVDGMRTITGTDKIKATVTAGNPNIFYNMTTSNTSGSHRLRYALEADQHDHVKWEEGDSDNSCPNSKDSGATNEQNQFNTRRNLTNNAVAISDFLILQTSSGDQSVIYFQSDPSPDKKTTELLEIPKTSKEDMWDNNPLSAANWEPDHINIGSYNGHYNRPTQKYEGTGNRARISTIFDNQPYGKTRPSRPSNSLRLINTNLDVKDALPNGEYITGSSTIFYEKLLDLGSGSAAYSKSYNSDYGRNGHAFTTTYSDNHAKINDIVIHNPVSAQNAIVMPLDPSRDQRTASTKNIGGNKQGDLEEIEYVLDCQYTGGTQHTPSCYTSREVTNPNYTPPSDPITHNFHYTGGVQEFIAPVAGTYTLKVWGASGGTSYSDNTGYGGRGGYSQGEKYLEQGDKLYIYVGGQGADGYPRGGYAAGGYNGGGQGSQYGRHDECGSGGGGATDMRTTTSLTSRIIVAGGGGGAGEDSEAGGSGGGLSGTGNNPGTQNSGHQLGYGQHCPSSDSGGGGGGGYYGGRTNPENAGSGGSGYIGGVSNATTTTGANSGHGSAQIITPAIPSGDSPTITLQTLNCQEPHHRGGHYDTCYKEEATTISPEQPVIIPDSDGNPKTYSPGKFINLDYPFDIHFPSTGDFYGSGELGIGRTTRTRGKGYTNGMNTSEWIAKKSVTFGFNVIYNNTMYKKWEEIPLPPNGTTYRFYCPLANKEEISSLVTFKVIAINGSDDNNQYPTNKNRNAGKAAMHSALRKYNIDLVGRIGNLVIEDTKDYRYSNLFKRPLSGWDVEGDWYINQVLKKVDITKQNNVVGSHIDIRGDIASTSNHYLNTYGLLKHLEKPNPDLWRQYNKPGTTWKPLTFPLSPQDNNIKILQKKPVTTGYKLLGDIQTIGDYYGNLSLKPYYYYMDLTKSPSDPDYIQPLDVYINDNGIYKPFNLFGEARSALDSSKIYPYKYRYSWEDEWARRNYTPQEEDLTKRVSMSYGYKDDEGNVTGLLIPSSRSFQFGTGQAVYLKGHNRTFIGTAMTKGNNRNPGSRLSPLLYGLQAQRWHFTLGLPSSAVVIKHGEELENNNYKKYKTKDGLIIMAAEIEAVGNVYTLQYEHDNKPIIVGTEGTSDYHQYPIPIDQIPYPVISVFSADKTSRNDLAISGTH